MNLITAYEMAVASYDIRKPYCIAQMVFIPLEGEGLDNARYWDEPEGHYRLLVWRRYATSEAGRLDPDVRHYLANVKGPPQLFILPVADLDKEQRKLNSSPCEED